jgi:anti-sigma B factor antagonist
MAIELSTREVAGVTIFDVSGRMIAPFEGQKLHGALMEAVEQGHRWLLINCAELTFIDSSGLGDLVAAHAEVARRGGVARLLKPAKALSDLLQRTRLGSLLEVYDDEEAAIASFNDAENRRAQEKLANYLQRGQ